MNETGTVIQEINAVVSPNYVALLEQVNEVHGTGLALANTFIAILALVLTALGIFVAIFTWRNSKEQKQERRELYLQHSAQLAEQHQVLVATYEEKIQSLMERVEGIAETAENTGNGVTDTKKQLEDMVTAYQSKLEGLKKSEQGISFASTSPIPMVKRRNKHQLDTLQKNIYQMQAAVDKMYLINDCPHCGGKYQTPRTLATMASSFLQDVCPHCGKDV